MRNSFLPLSIVAIAIGMVVVGALNARGQTPLAAKVENAIQTVEPEWRCHRGVLDAPWRQVPSERLLLYSVCDQTSQTDKRESIHLRIFQVDSRTDAKMCMGPVRQGKVAIGWKVKKFKIGDEGYLVTFRHNGRFEIHFRKGAILVTVSGESFSRVDRFAQLVAAQTDTT